MKRISTQEQWRRVRALTKAIPEISPAEVRICLLLLEYPSTRAIAAKLGLSRRTIENHRHRIRKKMGGAKVGNLVKALFSVINAEE